MYMVYFYYFEQILAAPPHVAESPLHRPARSVCPQVLVDSSETLILCLELLELIESLITHPV